MQELKRESYLSYVEQGNVIWEIVFLSQQSEYLSSLHEVEHQVDVDVVLEGLDEVDNEWVLDACKDVLLVLNVINLF